MANAGLSLNFAAGDLVLPMSTPKFKGGSWKERARLTKGARNARDARLGEKNQEGRKQAFDRAIRDRPYPRKDKDESQPAGQPPSKRRKRDDNNESQTERNERRRADRPAHLKDATFKAKGDPAKRDFISSLFSFNPQAMTAEEEPKVQTEPEQPVKPTNAPLPDGIDTFTSLGLSDSVAAHLLTKMALKTPTAIQRVAVSRLTKEDTDVFIQSETGSGKTLAYLLPIVQRLVTMAERQKQESTISQSLHRDSGLFAIILAPTRELCKQISVVLEKLLGCAHYIVAGTVIGGEKKKSEKARLRKGLNILVATPGRLVDHLENTQTLDVSKVRYLVLDEGDRLMDLGFEEDITKIVRALDGKKRKSERPGLPEKRITVLCSATLKSNVEKLGDATLRDAVLVKGDGDEAEAGDVVNGDGGSIFLAPAQLKQSYIVCASKLRLVTLTALLRRTFARKGSVMKAIVFFSCADSVDFHHKVLTRPDSSSESNTGKEDTSPRPTLSDPTASDTTAPAPLINSSTPPTLYRLHGSLPQFQRTSILNAFRTSTAPSLLLATDVASRGLDLPNLDLVIEYDPAFSKDDHLHRIGRTARLGRDGRAVIFLQPGSEEGYIQVLKDSYKPNTDAGAAPNVIGQSADDVLRKGFAALSGVVGKKDEYETAATEFQLDVEKYVLADARVKDMAKNAFQSHVRAYATHIASEREWFDIKGLHLGHLAKSFGLRDPPRKVNVAALRGKASGTTRPKANEGRKRGMQQDRGDKTGAGPDSDDEIAAMAKNGKKRAAADIDDVGDAEAAAEKMRQMVRNRKKMMGAGADEFNIA